MEGKYCSIQGGLTAGRWSSSCTNSLDESLSYSRDTQSSRISSFSWNLRLHRKISYSPLDLNRCFWSPSLCASLFLMHCVSLSLKVIGSWRFEALPFEPIYLHIVLRTQQKHLEKASSNSEWKLFRNGCRDKY